MFDNNFNEISFYIVAHADDWQLFMCPNVYNDIVAQQSKVIIIITTAGDAGLGEKFWKAREEGTKSSLEFCLSASGKFLSSGGVKIFNEHSVNYWKINNATVYFLRLPDGGLDGNGFEASNFQSLSKLRSENIHSITATDHSTTYKNWQDFFTTLEKIIDDESNGIEKKWLNYINPDATKNLNDHADHIATGHALQSMNIISQMQQALYTGYTVSSTNKKLNNAELFWKAGMFAAYHKAVFDYAAYSTLQENVNAYINWCLSDAEFIIINSENS